MDDEIESTTKSVLIGDGADGFSSDLLDFLTPPTRSLARRDHDSRRLCASQQAAGPKPLIVPHTQCSTHCFRLLQILYCSALQRLFGRLYFYLFYCIFFILLNIFAPTINSLESCQNRFVAFYLVSAVSQWKTIVFYSCVNGWTRCLNAMNALKMPIYSLCLPFGVSVSAFVRIYLPKKNIEKKRTTQSVFVVCVRKKRNKSIFPYSICPLRIFVYSFFPLSFTIPKCKKNEWMNEIDRSLLCSIGRI